MHGSVVAYNYFIDHTWTSGQTVQFGSIEPHQTGHMLNLYEGNQGGSLTWDNVHGTHNLDTIFRNQFMGRDSSQFSSSTVPGVFARFNRFMNVIGNVFGEAGYHTKYQTTPTDNASCNRSVYNLGAPNTCSTASNDLLTVTTMYRWGNYDVALGTTRFNSSEVPTGLTKYAQAVPASQTIPASFYLAARPSSWWKVGRTTPAWPPVGPDVTGGNVTSGTGAQSTLDGHAHKNPARLCYESLSNDPAYPALTIKTFNANNCYSAAP